MREQRPNSVAIILLNWNSYTDTFDCLKSLELLEYPLFHIYLADNNSSDNSFLQLQEDFKNNKFKLNITFIQTGRNLGFAGGNNVALKRAYENNHDYFWLLNNDTTVDTRALCELVKTINKDSSYGIVGSKILYHGTNNIWFAGGTVNRISGGTNHIGYGEKDKGQYNLEKEVGYITGCSLLVKKEIIDNVGYMIEDYFLYFEETDWNIRVSLNGYKIVYSPNSVVYHKVSSSSGGNINPAPFIDYYLLRNRYVLTKRYKKYFNRYTSFLFLLIEFIKKFIKILFKYKGKKIIRINYIVLGLCHGIKGKMGIHPVIK